MVMGNHEYYRRFVPDELALARERAAVVQHPPAGE